MSIAMAAQTEYDEEQEAPPPREEKPSRLRAAAEELFTQREASIVPADSISGRALLAVVLVRSAAGEWQSAVAREVTIQVRPSEQRDVEADVRNAVAVASAISGV